MNATERKTEAYMLRFKAVIDKKWGVVAKEITFTHGPWKGQTHVDDKHLNIAVRKVQDTIREHGVRKAFMILEQALATYEHDDP